MEIIQRSAGAMPTLSQREGRCFILDTNSTNHTYVNGVMIRSNEEVVLSEGDKIRLANEEFVFHG